MSKRRPLPIHLGIKTMPIRCQWLLWLQNQAVAILESHEMMMAEKKSPKSSQREKDRAKTEDEDDKLELNIVYKGKEYRLHLPKEANKETICKEIKRQTGVKGAFYLHYGDSSNSYLHSSSLTLSNISKLSGNSLEVRGGDWINKGGDSIWYYYSQTIKPNVQQRLTKQQFVPYDKPP